MMGISFSANLFEHDCEVSPVCKNRAINLAMIWLEKACGFIFYFSISFFLFLSFFLSFFFLFFLFFFLTYTRQKKKLLAFSFANFKITRWSTGKQWGSLEYPAKT